MSSFYLALLNPLTFWGVFLVFWIISLFLMVWTSRKVRGRTVREFVSTENIWFKVDAWAAQTGYKLVEQDQASRLYQRGNGLLVAPQMVKLTAMSGFYTIEAWVRMTKINKVITFGLVPEETVIDQGGLWGCIPRNRARNDVNRLLDSLGAPPISQTPQQQMPPTATQATGITAQDPWTTSRDATPKEQTKRLLRWIIVVTVGLAVCIALPLTLLFVFSGRKVDVNRAFNSGWTLMDKGEYNKAAAAFGKVIEMDPKYISAYGSRAAAFNLAGQYDKAIAVAKKGIELDPYYPGGYGALACAYDHIGQYDKAIVYASKALEVDPTHETAYTFRAIAYNNLHQYRKAIADADKAVGMNPQDEEAYMERGYAYSSTKQYGKAIADNSKVIELDPTAVGAYINRSDAYDNTGQYDKAIADANTAIKMNPSSEDTSTAYVNRGLAFKGKGHTAQAITDFRKALKLDPKDEDAASGLRSLGVPEY